MKKLLVLGLAAVTFFLRIWQFPQQGLRMCFQQNIMQIPMRI